MGYVDIHSHILPHMDDGASNMQQTLEMLRIAQAEGITQMIATPHYKEGRYLADSRQVKKCLQQVQEAAFDNGINIELYAGTEIYYHSGLEERLDSKRLCTMNGTEHVLVEFSPFENYTYIRNAMEELMSIGYSPILAHVERYQCMVKDVKNIKELRTMGCAIQVNAGSVGGEFGLKMKHFIQKLLKEKLVDYVGTDAHNTEGRKPAMKKCVDVLYKKCSRDYADAILFRNAQEYLLDT